MTTTDRRPTDPPGDKGGPKYEVNIEGTLYDWDHGTITVPQLRDLGHLPADTPVVEVDLKTNTERTLAENDIVELKPGQGFGRKVRFQRG